jgi:hypothetical protein
MINELRRVKTTWRTLHSQVPTSRHNLESLSNRESVIRVIAQKAQVSNTRYIDFAADPSLILNDDTDFRDPTHLNSLGARKVTMRVFDLYNEMMTTNKRLKPDLRVQRE